jgi:DNA-binding response OmpR family regulator
VCARDKILVVGDAAPARHALCGRLEALGYRVQAVATVACAVAALAGAPDLVVFDPSAVAAGGLGRVARRRRPSAGVLVLGRAPGVHFDLDLAGRAARIRSALRAQPATVTALSAATLPFGRFELDVARRRLCRTQAGAGRAEVALTELEFDLLFYLRRNPRRALSRDELLDRVWGYDRYPKTRTVDFHVGALRRKLEPRGAAPRFIRTVQRVGYRFDP